MTQVKNFLYSINTIRLHKNIIVVIVRDGCVVQKEQLKTYKYCVPMKTCHALHTIICGYIEKNMKEVENMRKERE